MTSQLGEETTIIHILRSKGNQVIFREVKATTH